jgi:transposase-like protein
MKRRTRRNFDPPFKAKVALEALKESKTLAELATKYDIHPNQISQWKSELLANSAKVFDGNKEDKSEIKDLQAEQEELHKRIGQQTMEIEFLKKNLKKLNLL